MDQGLLRKISDEYLVPLFSGAKLESQAVRSSMGEMLVAPLGPLKIAFKVNRDDDYRLVLAGPQKFAKRKRAILPEIHVVRAFVRAVKSMASELDSELKQDLLSTFQRKVVAGAIGGPVLEPLILSGIDQ